MGLVQLIDGRYEVLGVIASGGMATVSRARDTRLDRLVAIKRPHPGPPGNDLAERMAREARAAASLTHPNLVTVYDFGSDDDGPYLVMELVEGPTLSEVADVSAADVYRIGAELADGLAAIHRAGIVHRDVKPSNVIMSDRGPLLTDFGIALDPTMGGQITAPGAVVATPSFAAPEVLAGARPSPASDIFSLGLVVEELAGKAGIGADPGLGRVLAAAKAVSASDRPDADTFADSLRGAAPTLLTPPRPDMSPASTGDPTLILDATPAGIDPDQAPSQRPRSGPAWKAMALLGGAAVLLTLLGLAMGEPKKGDLLAGTTTSASGTSTTPATTTSSSSTSTTIGAAQSLEEARRQLETLLLSPPRDDFKSREVEDLLKKVDEAEKLAGEGKPDKAGDKLSEVLDRISKKLSADDFAEAESLLQTIADLLGVELEHPHGP